MHLVDEQHDRACGVGDLLQHGFETILKLAPVLGARNEGTKIEPHDSLVLKRLGDVAVHDPLGKTLDDRGFSHARLTDQHRIVLRPAREHLDHTPDLIVAPDHRVELPLARQLGEIAPVSIERLVLFLGVRIGDALVTADLLEDLQERLARDARRTQNASGGTVLLLNECEEEVLEAHVLVLEGFSLAERGVEQRVHAAAQRHLPRAGHPRHLLQLGGRLTRDRRGVRSELAQEHRDHAFRRVREHLEKVLGLDLGMLLLRGQPVRPIEGLPGLHRQLVQPHGFMSPSSHAGHTRPRVHP